MKTTQRSAIEASERVFSFLVSGPRFRVSIPSDFDRTPELNAPLYNGIGGRDFTFHPRHRDVRAEGYIQLPSIKDRDDRSVEVFERLEPPPLWWLKWPLAQGSLYTHLREEDGPEMAELTAGSISVEETAEGLPFVLAYPPLAIDMARVNGFSEEATYFSSSRGPGWGIRITRPGFLSKGEVEAASMNNTGGSVVIVAGVGEGVESTVISGDSLADGERIVTMVLDSFTSI